MEGLFCSPAHNAVTAVDDEEVSSRVECEAVRRAEGGIGREPTVARVEIKRYTLNISADRVVAGHR